MEYMTNIAQFILLNLIFLLSCLPVVTIGPSIAALYQVVMRETRGEHGYIIRKFFLHMKEMFLQAFLTSLTFGALILLLIFNVSFWNAMSGALAGIIVIFLYIILFLVVCSFLYVFPLMARFKNSFITTLKNSLLIAVTNPKTTLILLAIHALTAAIVYYFPPAKVFLLLIGFSFLAYCNSFLLNKVFQRYEGESD